MDDAGLPESAFDDRDTPPAREVRMEVPLAAETARILEALRAIKAQAGGGPDAHPYGSPAAAPPPHAAPSNATRSSHEPSDALESLLRLAASRGASTVYVAPNTVPQVRVNGELLTFDGAVPYDRDELEMMLVAQRFRYTPTTRRAAAATEWSFDLADSRVRCTTFRDQRGAGAVFRLTPRSAAAAASLSLDAQMLAGEPDGLVIVAGPRDSGKHAVACRLAELAMRTRRAYVVVVQRDAAIITAGETGAISHREVRGGLDDMLDAARAAIRENPDVLVLQEARSAPLMALALDAAASGQLVIAGITAPTTLAALERVVELYPPDQAQAVLLRLSQQLRAVIGQVAVPAAAGARVIAQEVLLNTPSVANALATVEPWQLRLALDAARKDGMVPLADVLVDLVRSGDVRADDAHRRAPDPAAFLESLEREGIRFSPQA